MLLLRRTEFVDSKLTVIWRPYTLAFMAMLNEQRNFFNQKHPIFLDLHSSVLFNKHRIQVQNVFTLNSSFYHALLKGRIGKIEQASQIPWDEASYLKFIKRSTNITFCAFRGKYQPLERLIFSSF